MLARDVMTPKPQALGVTAPVREALELLEALDVRHLPVVNAQREVVGMLSDRDLGAARGEALEARITGRPSLTLAAPVSRYMSGDPVTVEEDEDLSAVVDAMIDHRIGAVPIVDADGALVGIVSYVDVLRSAVGERH